MTRQPIRWRPGLHFSDRPIAFDGLLLFHTRYADMGQGLRRLAQSRSLAMVGVEEGFGYHWTAADAAFRTVVEAAQAAPYRMLDAPMVRHWEELLTATLRSSPPNAVEHVRHLWDVHPSWFLIPDRFAHVG